MKNAAFAGLLVIASLALMAARPGTEQQLVQQLNGQPTRLVMPDAGASGVFNGSGALACMPITGLKNSLGAAVNANVFVIVPVAPAAFCLRPSVSDPLWDGGCNLNVRDINGGVPMAAGVPQYITPASAATTLCMVSDAGVISAPVWWVE